MIMSVYVCQSPRSKIYLLYQCYLNLSLNLGMRVDQNVDLVQNEHLGNKMSDQILVVVHLIN